LRQLYNKLKLRGQLNWHEWVKIGKLKVGAKSREDIAELVECAWTHEKHPAFHEDIQQYIYNIFDIAIAALKEYDEYKKRRGLIDYIDMEIQVKRLLDHPDVKAVLSEELDLLMVDEFQDTSPIQLEIFLKLAQLAEHSVWVGDPKQSIYGFRGADPKLMRAVIDWAGGVKPENIQRYSWRSREDIVFATNALFCKAFDEMPADQVALAPKRCKMVTPDSKNREAEPIEMGDALIHYHFKYEKETGARGAGSKTWFANCVAEAAKELLAGGTVVQPKDETAERPARPGDLAILCRSNKECQEMADALHRAGLKAAISRSGLLNTAEARLILACLKYILNEADSLSVAEILLLADRQRIEDIVDNRLEFLTDSDGAEGPRRYDLDWGKDSPIIQQLSRLREETSELSSTEILNLVLADLDLRRIIVSWGNTRQRLDNVDVLRRFALQYEEACNRLHVAASLGGFLLYLNDLQGQGKDHQGSGEGPDAVQVMTYHRSKGLEWPVVFCHALENNLRDDVWGIGIVSESDEFDINDVLGNRWIRYWVNPYSDQRKGTPLQERIAQSPEQKEAHQQALAEEARLLYVGITRARDYLVLPTRERPSQWLNRVWHKGKGDLPTLDEHTPESPWEWNNNFLLKRTEVRSFPKDFTAAELPEPGIRYFEPYRGKEMHQPFEWDLRQEGLRSDIKAKSGTKIQYGAPLPHHEAANQYQMAKLLKAFLIADRLDYPSAERQQMGEGFLQRYELEGMVTLPNLLYQS
ncbi:MAG: UvrD-helicase domain-containing protein, partial [Bacteroidota bacterium]